MNTPSWDDLRLFLLVVEAGGLSGAGRAAGLSPPTLGRRMLALEQATGRALFVRSAAGYAPTPEGEALAARVRAMRSAARPVEAFVARSAEAPVLRLSAGTATAGFLADRHAALCRPGDGFRLCFVTTEAVLDLARREADAGIRNRPPAAGNLASRPLGRLRFAPYRAQGANPDAPDWIALDPAAARHPAAHWVLRRSEDHGEPVAAWATQPATMHQLVRAGAGRAVLPCMIGDTDPGLARAGDVIPELDERQFLVMHDDDRHRPPLRRLSDRLTALYADAAPLLAGERPLRG